MQKRNTDDVIPRFAGSPIDVSKKLGHSPLNFGNEQLKLDEPAEASCRIREIRLNEDLKGVVQSWKNCNSSFQDHSIHCDPDWMAQHFKGESKNVHIYLLEKGREILGAVPFALYEQPLLCRLGDSVVAKFPIRVLDLQGFAPNLPHQKPCTTCCSIEF